MAAIRIKEALTTDILNAQLEAVLNLKKLFSPPDRIFSKLKLQPLLRTARVFLVNEALEIDFILKYGFSLLDFIGKDEALDSEILHQVELILGKSQDEKLIAGLWSQLEKNFMGPPDGVLNMSKPIIERAVLEWVVDAPDNKMEFFFKISADSPKLFQTVASILYEVLVRTRGHMRVFELTSLFVGAVKRECKKKERSFLGLYPKGCRRLVSLMRCPPELCCEEGEHLKKEIVLLLLEMFLTNRRRALILLSHFTKWMRVFKVHLEKVDI